MHWFVLLFQSLTKFLLMSYNHGVVKKKPKYIIDNYLIVYKFYINSFFF